MHVGNLMALTVLQLWIEFCWLKISYFHLVHQTKFREVGTRWSACSNFLELDLMHVGNLFPGTRLSRNFAISSREGQTRQHLAICSPNVARPVLAWLSHLLTCEKLASQDVMLVIRDVQSSGVQSRR